MGYDPKVSGPWSDADDYPAAPTESDPMRYEARMRQIDASGPVGYTLGGPPSWIGRGLFYWGDPWGGNAVGFVTAFLLAVVLIGLGVGVEMLLIWLLGRPVM